MEFANVVIFPFNGKGVYADVPLSLVVRNPIFVRGSNNFNLLLHNESTGWLFYFLNDPSVLLLFGTPSKGLGPKVALYKWEGEPTRGKRSPCIHLSDSCAYEAVSPPEIERFLGIDVSSRSTLLFKKGYSLVCVRL